MTDKQFSVLIKNNKQFKQTEKNLTFLLVSYKAGPKLIACKLQLSSADIKTRFVASY